MYTYASVFFLALKHTFRLLIPRMVGYVIRTAKAKEETSEP